MIGKLLSRLFVALLAVLVRYSHETSCPYPVPPKHAVLSARSYLDEFNFNGFQAYQRVDFICRVGYRQTKGAMWSICGVSGRWYPDTRQAGECTRELRTGEIECKGRFRCRKDLQCIDRKLRCDCKPDCRDGTDEIGCKNPKKIIFISSAGQKKSGVLTSPNYPLGYAKSDFRCHFIFYTDPTYRIKMSFEDFSLRERSKTGRCVDQVKLIGVDGVYKKKFENEEKGKKTAITSCGSSTFGVVISNSSQLDMVVRLTGVKVPASVPRMKGYSLSWGLISQRKATEIVGQIRKSLQPSKVKSTVESKPKGKSTSENLFTILLPVTISALLPLSMLLFLCYHIRAKRTRNAREGEAKSERLEEAIKTGGEIIVDKNAGKMGTKTEVTDLPLMLRREKTIDGSEYNTQDEKDTLLTSKSLEATKAQEYRRSTHSSPEREFNSLIMTVDVDVRENCGRFTKSRAASEETFRKSKHASTARTFDSDNLSADIDKKAICNGMKVRSCDWNASYDGRRKYLEKSSRPQSKVMEEDIAQTANRRCGVCFCDDCENRRAEIDQFIPLTCEFDTVEESCTEFESARPQYLDGDGGCDRELAGLGSYGREDVANERQRIRSRGRVRNGERVRNEERLRHGKRRRRHGKKSRNISTCPKRGVSSDNRKHAFVPLPSCTDSYHQNCNVCAHAVKIPSNSHRDSRESDQRFLEFGKSSNRSNSSDSGTCTGSEAPTKWHPQDSVHSVRNASKCRSDTDSGSRESAYAESFDECAKFSSCQHCSAHGNPQHKLQRYSENPPSRRSYGYCGDQDGRAIMADIKYGNGERLESYRVDSPERTCDVEFRSSMPNRKYCDYMEAYTETDDCIVYAATEGNFSKLPIDNSHLFREEFFQNRRRSNENLFYEDNAMTMTLPDSMPSYAVVCECEACTYSRLNDSFIYGNGPLNATSSTNAVLPWQQNDCRSDLERSSETNLNNLTLIK